MNWLDRIIAQVSPVRGLQRAHARRILAGYDATRPSRTRKVTKDNSTGEVQVVRDAATARAMARDMERNHDLVRGVIGVLVRNVVGPNGIGIEPTPRLVNDDIDDDFARQLLALYRDWCKHPEVTGTMDWVMCQELAARSWFRDGEMFAQVLEGPVSYLDHGTLVPFSLELLEADHVPLDYERDSPDIEGGIERNAWGRPVAYWMHKRHPGGSRPTFLSEQTLKRVPAERILHLALRDRISGLRGVSQLASALGRYQDIAEYENNERIAARIASAISAFIKRDPMMGGNTPPDGETSAAGDRIMRLQAGLIFDQLQPGESIEMLNPNRPNPNLGRFREDQLRAAAAGTDTSFSSSAKNYNGTYSAQRQELVEQQPAYVALTNRFVAMFVRPTWERLVRTAILSGQIKVPRNIRPETVAQAEFRGPPMPWINPVHEANALETMVRNGFRSAQSVISERGGRMQDTYEQLARERRLAAELNLVLDCDAATERRAAAPAQAADPMLADPPPAPPATAHLNGNVH